MRTGIGYWRSGQWLNLVTYWLRLRITDRGCRWRCRAGSLNRSSRRSRWEKVQDWGWTSYGESWRTIKGRFEYHRVQGGLRLRFGCRWNEREFWERFMLSSLPFCHRLLASLIFVPVKLRKPVLQELTCPESPPTLRRQRSRVCARYGAGECGSLLLEAEATADCLA